MTTIASSTAAITTIRTALITTMCTTTARAISTLTVFVTLRSIPDRFGRVCSVLKSRVTLVLNSLFSPIVEVGGCFFIG